MNTKNLKAYAPKARRQFMDAVAKRAAHFGIYQDEIAPVTFEGSTAIIEGKAFSKQQGEQRKRLEKQVTEKPLATYKERYELFIREMAYTWFNRLAALRYMELHDYLEHGFRVLSNPNNKEGLPEILDHAADVADTLELNKAQIIEWQLAGDKQEVLYRELLLGQCHHLHSIMPFLFEAIDDATELLLPDNLTKTDSILKGLVNDIPEEDWKQIEVIGWLYQFYISEHKDAVIGKVVKSEDIPAATQLFTPNWIVKYLVQNSIGRQWLATYPDSSIKAKMEYYIEPAEQTDEVNAQLAEITPSSIDPETIKALDPAAGSGHILVEIYELLREIYLERGYRLREIPELILTKNIYGLDIDDRAAQLAGFALLMKAREDDRRIFQRVQDGSVKLNVYALQSTEGWDSALLWQSLNLDGKAKQGSSGELFAEEAGFQHPTGQYAEYFDLLKYLIVSFEQAKTLGSLIQIDHQYLPTLEKFKEELLDKLQATDPAAIVGAEQLLPVVEQAIVLVQKYDAVIANPPYMGRKGMNSTLKDFAKKIFPNSKSDLFAIFMERAFSLLYANGHNAQINMQSWMFLSSYEDLRKWLLESKTLIGMAHLGSRAFGQISGEVVQTAAWVFVNSNNRKYRPTFSRLVDGVEEDKKNNLPKRKYQYSRLAQEDFFKVPGAPITYWISDTLSSSFRKYPALHEVADIKQGLATADNDRFLRYWYEVNLEKCSFNCKHSDTGKRRKYKWFPHSKGGGFKKWYGKREWLINWENEGNELHEFKPRSVIRNPDKYFKKCLSWSLISGSGLSFRLEGEGNIIGHKGPGVFVEEEYFNKIFAVLNSKVAEHILNLIAPGLGYEIGQVSKIPVIDISSALVEKAVSLAEEDWNSFETSWDFSHFLDLIGVAKRHGLVKKSVLSFVNDWASKTKELKDIEETINELSIAAYGLSDELSPSVQINKVSLENNFAFSFGSQGQSSFTASVVERIISFFIGCNMGRFSLDKEGIVYALSGNEGFKELISEGAYQTFPADDDGIIPLAQKEWLFEDDATARFREFVKTVWGTEHLQENLEFVAESLCLNAMKPKKGESVMETIRRYFSEKFFADHCKMYKKRPIYWLFSSGKEKAFECLVYLHRYNEATLSRMRTEYVTPLMGKYDHQLVRKAEEVVEAAGTELRRIEKEIKDLEKKQLELRQFDEELKHYAEMRITLDLDDGVKANYGKFGNLLANVKAIHGKAVK